MLLLLPALVACRPPSTPGPRGATSVRFELPTAGALDWGTVPWPSDLYLDADGRIALGTLPTDTALADPLREALAARPGFCTTCALSFTIDGGLADVPGHVDTLDDAIVLADVQTGTPVPLDVQWAEGRLTVRPSAGVVLSPDTRYAVAVTDGLHGDDGLPVSPAPAFEAVRRRRPDADPRALAILSPAFGVLDPERVVGLGVFTTGDPGAQIRGLRDTLRSLPPTPPEVDGVWTGEALDTLLGVPSDDGPGVDVPPVAGTEGTRSVRHETTAVVVSGTFRAPRFVEGTGTDVGVLSRGPDGAPVASSEDEVPFVLIVPRGADVSRLPVLVDHHGFNSSRTTGFALADTVGRAGFAVLSIDAYQHGARAASAQDEVHAMRGGTPGADGFAETSELDVSGRVFGLLGPPPDRVLSPEYPLAAFTQFAADALWAIHLVHQGDWSAVEAADPALDGLAFDLDHVVFGGNSMGAVVGAQVLSAETDLAGGLLTVLPGSIVDTLAASGEFQVLVNGVLLPAIGVEGTFDEVERHLGLEPVVDLYRQILEPVDPLALAPGLGQVPDLLVQLAGHDEVAAPGPGQAAVSAAGLGGIGTFALAPVAPADVPARAAVVRYDGAMHGMLENRHETSTWEDPLVPPLESRPEAVTVDNPIEAVHDQIRAFFEGVVDGTAAIR